MNEQLQAAVQALRNSAAKGKTKKAVLENIENISSATVLLNSSRPSNEAFSKLASVLRAPLIPLYTSYTETALKAAATILKVLTERLCLDEESVLEKEIQERWEKVAYSLLSGVIDYIETNVTETAKAAIASALYAPICSLFFDERTIGSNKVLDAALKSTAFMLLSESSASHPANQAKLRSPKTLGGVKLGIAISKTKDYVVLEALLNLFARLLPSSSTAKDKHTQFVQEVFGKAFATPKVSKSIQKVLVHASAKDWEETASNLFDIFASADISFPQPFDVQDVVVCGNTYPQPNVSDKFCIDRSTFFVNVEQEDGLYESLLIHFSTVQCMSMVTKGESVFVTATLNSVPSLADQPIVNHSSETMSLELLVNIRESDRERFIQALRHRKLEHVLIRSAKNATLERRSRVSVTESSALLEFRADGKKWESDPPSFDKVKEVENFYASAFDKSMSPDKNELGEPTKQASSTNVDHVALVENAVKETIEAAPDVRTEIVLGTDLSVDGKASDEKDIRNDRKGGTGRRFSSRTQLRISVYGDGDEMLSDIDELEKGNVDKVLQANGSADNDEELSTEVTQQKRREALRKVAHRRIDSDEEQAISETDKNIEKSTRTTRSSVHSTTVTPTSTKKVQEVSSKDTKGRPYGRATKKTRGKLEDISEVKETPSDAEKSVLSKDNTAQVFQTDDRPVQDIVNDTSSTGIYEESKKMSPRRSGKQSTTAVTGKNNVNDEDVKSIPVANKRAAKLAAFEPALHSSPLSRVSKMKGKYGGAAAKKLKTNPKKRPAEDTVPIECPPSPKRKKPYSLVPEKVGSDSKRLSSKYRAQGRATKENTKDIDWEQIPSSDVRIAVHPSSPSAFKLASKKVAVKNADKPSVKIVKTDLKTKAKVKEVAKPKEATGKRGPLREKDRNIPLEPRQKNPIDEQRMDNKQPRVSEKALEDTVESDKVNVNKPQSMIAQQKGSALPSLEDVLLRGATLTIAHPDPATIELEEMVEDVTDGKILEDHREAFEGTVNTDILALDEFPAVTDILDNPKLLSPVSDEVVELPIVMGSSPAVTKSATATKKAKPRLIDLTEDMMESDGDISRVPLPTKKLEEKDRSLVIDLETPTQRYTGDLLSAGVRGPKNLESAKAKVKFDEKPRYKSASFEGLVERVKGGTERYHGEISRKKMGLTGNRIGHEVAPVRKEFDGIKSKEPGMSEIIGVINSIQDVIISNIGNKSRAVRSDIRIARDRLLHEAMSDLQDMRAESIGHYNVLISLETDYANASRKLVNSYEAVENVNREICTFVQQSIKAHDRKTISKNLPQSLFVAGLPSLFKKLTG